MRLMIVAVGALELLNLAAQVAIQLGILPPGWMPGGR